MPKFIEIPLMGGLGNQLFQLAAGIEISKVSGRPTKFSTHFLDLPASSGTTKRNIGILDLLLTGEVHVRNLVSGMSRVVFNRVGRSSHKLIEQNFQDDLTKRVLDDTRYVQGYFQNWEIVKRSWPELESRFRNSENFAPAISLPVEQRIALHMRYGDYRTNDQARAFHGLTGASYFIDAISMALGKGEKPSVLILSDEPEHGLSELNAAGLSKDLEINFGNSKNKLGDLALMASSTSVITSNSSFSWWGSWIASQRSNASVYMPTPWFSSNEVKDPALHYAGASVLTRRVIN